MNKLPDINQHKFKQLVSEHTYDKEEKQAKVAPLYVTERPNMS